MNRFVADASVVVKLFFDEEHSSIATAHVRNAVEVLSPDFVYLETTNVILTRMKRDKLDIDATRVTLQTLFDLAMTAHPTRLLVKPAFEIAAETGRSVYDCTYLALALREQCPLVTADERFFNALKSSRFSPHIRLVSKLPA